MGKNNRENAAKGDKLFLYLTTKTVLINTEKGIRKLGQ
jgi:hypothetical protein